MAGDSYEPAHASADFGGDDVVMQGELRQRVGRKWRARHVTLDRENLFIYKVGERAAPEVGAAHARRARRVASGGAPTGAGAGAGVGEGDDARRRQQELPL